MRERAIHLVDTVFPHVRIRQWVLTVPFQIRYLLAYNPSLVTVVLTIYVRVISAWIRKKTRRKGRRKVHTGSVTVVQRSGGSLNLMTHYHGLFLDGYFAADPGSGKMTFHKIKAPTDQDVASIAGKIAHKVIKRLTRMGYLSDANDEYIDSTFETFLAASVQYRTAMGERAGKGVRMLGADPQKALEPVLKGKLCATVDGFSIHANTQIGARNRMGLEKMCAYISRPPLSNERLSRQADGQIILRLKRPFSDGTAAILFEPLELIEKLAALVPPPWGNLARFHGCFAPNSNVRARIVPKSKGKSSHCPNRLQWRELLRRSFGIDIFKCRYCGGKTKIIPPLLNRDGVKEILDSLGLSSTAPPLAPARSPPQTRFDWGA